MERVYELWGDDTSDEADESNPLECEYGLMSKAYSDLRLEREAARCREENLDLIGEFLTDDEDGYEIIDLAGAA